MPTRPPSAQRPDVLALAVLGAMLVPLDALRSALLRSLGRRFRAWLVDPALRVAWLGSAGLIVVFGLVLAAPGFVLLYGPLLLGLPHLVADVRYLVVAPRFHRRPAVVLGVLLPCLFALVVPVLEVAAVTMVAASLVARGRLLPRAGLATLGVAIGWLGHATDERAELVFAHLHNLLAFAWLFLAYGGEPRTRRLLALPALLTALLLALLATGVCSSLVPELASRISAAGIPPYRFREVLAPLHDPRRADDLVLAFAFGQAAHYAVWLRFVPEFARGRAAPRTFARSLSALADDFAPLGVALFALAALALLGFAAIDAETARDGYLRLALFHGPLELALFGLFLLERPSRCP